MDRILTSIISEIRKAEEKHRATGDREMGFIADGLKQAEEIVKAAATKEMSERFERNYQPVDDRPSD